ncbi:MAG: type II toxin-antitoxin system HicA family toxin [Anaerolineae bacterium]|nr:type II toxin-antitoxin system HicA family toxin [Anaerolineae bacterium]
MVNRRKLFKRLILGSRDLRFDEFTALLEGFSFALKRISGSHHIYVHPEIPRPFPVQPRGDGKAKSYQVDQFLKLVEQYNLSLGDRNED